MKYESDPYKDLLPYDRQKLEQSEADTKSRISADLDHYSLKGLDKSDYFAFINRDKLKNLLAALDEYDRIKLKECLNVKK